jgi:anthranilate phosphoribosyltransferase
MLKHYTTRFRNGHDLEPADAEALFDAIMIELDESVLVELLDSWNAKGASIDELFAFAAIMRRRMKRISSTHTKLVDVVGTGGSRGKTFNVSTAATFVIAAAGVPVAKHGNRAASSNSGSADVMSALGIDIDTAPEVAERCLNDLAICFMFAPRFHALSPVLAAARRALGRPTIFNNLGPLCNPAGAPHQLIGVWDRGMLEPTAKVLARLGTSRSWIVHGEDGLDEISLSAKTCVAEVTGERVTHFEISAEDFGIEGTGEVPSGCSSKESAALISEILRDQRTVQAAEKLVLVNAAAAIYLAGSASTIAGAYRMAEQTIRSGAARKKLTSLAEATSR